MKNTWWCLLLQILQPSSHHVNKKKETRMMWFFRLYDKLIFCEIETEALFSPSSHVTWYEEVVDAVEITYQVEIEIEMTITKGENPDSLEYHYKLFKFFVEVFIYLYILLLILCKSAMETSLLLFLYLCKSLIKWFNMTSDENKLEALIYLSREMYGNEMCSRCSTTEIEHIESGCVQKVTAFVTSKQLQSKCIAAANP